MTIQFNGIQDVADLYRDTYQLVDDGIWAAGDVLALAHAAGFGLNAILQACARERSVSRASVNNHMRTAIIFPPEKRAKDVSWTVHYVCAQQATMNKPETHGKAHEWLDKVIKGTDNKRWGKAQLEQEIAAAKGNPHKGEPVYLLRNVECTVIPQARVPFTGYRELSVYINEKDLPTDWHEYGAVLRITLLKPAAEVQQLDAQESAA